MIRRQDLVNELKELLQQLSTDESSNNNNNNNKNNNNNSSIAQQQCQKAIQQHDTWLSSTLDGTTPREQQLKDALQQIHLQLLLLQQEEESSYAQIDATQHNSSNNNNMLLLQAYALYQMKQYEQVLDLLQDKEFESLNHAFAALHLQAQSYYHLHDMDSALALYSTILEDLDAPDDVHEVYINYMAAFLNQFTLPYCGESSSQDDAILNEILTLIQQQDDTKDDTMLDLRYNVATFQLLHNSNAQNAKRFLQSRRSNDTACKNQYEWSQHYWQGTMKGIRFQLADSKNMKNTKDPWLLLQYYHDKYETLDQLPHNNKIKWTLLQQRLFEYNRCVALLHQKQYDACRLAAEELWETMAPEKPPEKDDPALNDPVLLWWEVRLAVLLLYCCPAENNNNNNKSTTTHKKKTTKCLELRSVRALEFTLMSLSETPFRDHTLVYLQSHQAVSEDNSQQPSLEALYSDWPPSLRRKPAVQATLVAQQQQTKEPLEQGNSTPKNKETALLLGHWHFNQGNYPVAIECYEMALSQVNDSETKQIIQARLVQALTRVDPDKAMKLWKEMSVYEKTKDNDYDVHAMEALEENPPRSTFHKIVSNPVVVMGSSIAVTNNESATTDSTKKSRDSVLKQRARRRDQYLKQLQEKGLYNPERPTQPDSERWIPKYDRAANRRRKRNQAPAQNKHQGTGKISEKDLARLDVAARQQQPKNQPSSTPSTAHMSASGVRKGGNKRR